MAALPGGEKADGGKNGADAGRAVEMTAGWKARKTLLLERERTKVLAGVSHSFHRPWKSLRDSHIPTATTNPILSDEQGDISIELPRGTFLSSLDNFQINACNESSPMVVCRRAWRSLEAVVAANGPRHGIGLATRVFVSSLALPSLRGKVVLRSRSSH